VKIQQESEGTRPGNCNHVCTVNDLRDENRSGRWGPRHRGQEAGWLAVLAHFLRLVRLDCARHTAKVESPRLAARFAGCQSSPI